MTPARYDALVLGGGPAGAATALSLQHRGHTTALVEASGYDAERVGETLAPPVGVVLAHLGARDAFAGCGEHVPSYATRAAWGDAAPAANPFVLSAHGTGWQVDRRRFDELLATCAEQAGATVLRRARATRAQRTGAGWEVLVRRAADPGEARARGSKAPGELLQAAIVVDATGRRARFATARGARKLVTDRLVAVHGVFDGVAEGEPGVLVEACRDGWWYSARLPRERAVVALLSDADVVAGAGLRSPVAWAAALRRLPCTMQRIAGATWPARLRVDSARTQRLDGAAGDGWLAAGDAAATVDPLSSQGILKALRGGIFASYAISDLLGGDAGALDRYAAFVASEHEDDLAARAVHYGRERRFAGAPFWERRRGVRAAA